MTLFFPSVLCITVSFPPWCAVLLHFCVDLEADGEDEDEEEEEKEEEEEEVSPEHGNHRPPSSIVLDVDLKWFITNTPAAPNPPVGP